MKIEQLAFQWMKTNAENAQKSFADFYCETRDVFEARNNRIPEMLIEKGMDEGAAYLIFAILGELGNNSFDHNLANWPNIPGIFYAVEYDGKHGMAIVLDRGLGVFATLRKAVPDLMTDEEALELAFTKKISSRVFENRGNGLKFVRKNVVEQEFLLNFWSGQAQVFINHVFKVLTTEERLSGCCAILTF